ncbi:MAG: hypothetical protein A2V58_09265 [Candidatus Muproteobacteria bacterium RBG_19FT_COMBO_61_10]|uniref:BrnT family toxin n=1 Tax=Candidatus Muproteobacteria bacterium RBG_19FT_COMBO_61_10 TaxID=1817761 RepID=A0A1F6UK36_9PROT|nr:MAG: hypothetical protein A2V58_09265 [Candidatus Muproteobacteria bacterium RBG_19FT_COMBO_61_10]
MHVEWDENKNLTNQSKHGVSFGLAQEVFGDPLALSRFDRFEDGEGRWQTLGIIERVVLLLVIHTVRHHEDEEIIRIISARKATAHERRQYEKG